MKKEDKIKDPAVCWFLFNNKCPYCEKTISKILYDESYAYTFPFDENDKLITHDTSRCSYCSKLFTVRRVVVLGKMEDEKIK